MKKRIETNEITERYMGVETAESLTGLSRWTWRRWAYQGIITSVKAGRRLLIPASEIDRVMREGTRARLKPSSDSQRLPVGSPLRAEVKG